LEALSRSLLRLSQSLTSVKQADSLVTANAARMLRHPLAA